MSAIPALVITGICLVLGSCGNESGSVSLTSPDCGETFAAGGSIDIAWTESGIANVDQLVISFSNDNGATWAEIGQTNPGIRAISYSPTPADIGDFCLVKVASAGGSIVDKTDMVFSVVPGNARFYASCGTSLTPITLLYPAGGDTFHIGDIVQIKFAISPDFGYGQVVAKVSANGGRMPFVNINPSPINLPARTFLWTVPDTILSGTMTISLAGRNYFRVSDYGGNQESPAMQVPVTIVP
jgi:hypothetical protein